MILFRLWLPPAVGKVLKYIVFDKGLVGGWGGGGAKKSKKI